MLYVTPARYRTMGYGAALGGIGDSELANQLSVASSLVNRYCNAPKDYDFRGGSVTDEKHRWEIGNGYAPGTQRIWPDRRPLKSLAAFRIQVTNTQYLDVAANYVFDGGYLEPVIAASSIGVWSYGAVPVAGLVVPVAKISYDYGYDYPITDEVLQREGGSSYRAEHQWWTNATATVKVDGTPVGFTVDRVEGLVTLSVPVLPTNVVTASYVHKLPWEVRDATGLIATDLLGNRAIVAAGMQGISGIRVEEVEIRQSRDSLAARQQIAGLAASLLDPYRWMGFA